MSWVEAKNSSTAEVPQSVDWYRFVTFGVV